MAELSNYSPSLKDRLVAALSSGKDPQARRQRFMGLFGVDPAQPSGDFAKQTLKNFAGQAAPYVAAEALGPMAGMAGNAARAAPKLTAALLGTAGAASGAADAGEVNLTKSQKRELEIQRQQQQMQMEAEARRQQGQTQADEARRQGEVSAQRQRDLDAANARMKEQQMRAEFELGQHQKEMDQPFAERHPFMSTAMAVGAPAVSGALAAAGMGSIASKGNKLLGLVEKAKAAGDVQAMQEAMARLANWRRTVIPKQALSIAVPATAPIDARIYGDVVDKYSLPESSKAQQHATQRLGDVPSYLANSEQALASGLIGSLMGGKVGSMAAPAPRGDAGAMLKLYGGKDATQLGETLGTGADASAALRARMGAALASPKTQFQGSQLEQAPMPPQPQAPGAGGGPAQLGHTEGSPLALSAPATEAASANAPAPQTSAIARALIQTPSVPAPKRVIGGTHPDHDWDTKTGRWRDVDGQFLPGPPPKD